MDNDEKHLFSRRLRELCEEKNLPEHGRQTILRKEFKISQEAVRKWLDGESIPKHDHKINICKYFGVNYEWLATGKGDKHPVLSDAEKLLSMLGIKDPKDIDVDQVEIIRNAMSVPKEDRPHLKRIIKTFTEPDKDDGEQGNSG